MSQQINLYQVEKQKFKIRFEFKEAVVLFSVFFSIIFITTTIDMVKHLTIKKEYSVLDKEQQAKSQKLQVISGQMPEEQTRNDIVAQIKKYQDDKQSKLEILGQLAVAQSGKNINFSDYFVSLAKRAVTGLWLTSFSIKDSGGNLSIEGITLKPDYVPLLISGLSSEAVFSGKTFQLFKISTDDKTNQIGFELETKAVDEP